MKKNVKIYKIVLLSLVCVIFIMTIIYASLSSTFTINTSTVNQGVLGSSPSWGAIYFGQLVKWLNTPPFHGGIHGFEFHTGHQF